MKRMQTWKQIVLLSALCQLFSGCWLFDPSQPEQPLQAVCVVDVTQSVEPAAQAEALAAVQQFGGKLQRGDSLTVIPLTGDALTETPGKVLRFKVNTRREAYDDDLRRLTEEVAAGLKRLHDEVAARPFRQSDVLGALALAAEELKTGPENARRVVVMLSDLIQDDKRFNFRRDERVANVETAREFGRATAPSPAMLSGVRCFLGLVRSSDLQAMPPARRDAVKVWWCEYLQAAGAASVEWWGDGAGRLAAGLNR